MKLIHRVFAVAGLLIVGAVTWRILTLPKVEATWLKVEAPGSVAARDTFTLRITPAPSDNTLFLVADLHGWTTRNHPLGVISHAPPRRLDAAVSPIDVALTVPALPDLSTVRAVIYLSPTGNWSDHLHVANSDEIPVKSSADSLTRKLEPLPVHDLVPDQVIPRVESTFLRYVIAGLWLVVMITLGMRLKAANPGSAESSQLITKAPTFALLVACLATVLVEILGAEESVGGFARQIAMQHGFYEERHFPQQVAVLLTVVGVAAVILLVVYRVRQRRLVCGLLIYAVISVVATLSLHETDALLYTTFLGQPVEQLAKLAAVGLSLWGLRSQDKTSDVA